MNNDALRRGASIVVARLKEHDAISENDVHQTVFLTDPTRPRVRRESFERLRFSDPSEWVPEDSLDQLENAKGGFAVGVNPPAQILETMRVDLAGT